MKKTIILIMVLVLAIISFFILEIDEQDLGGNYYYLPAYEAVDVGYPGGAIIYKSQQKYSYSDVKIQEEVISVNNNKDFVVAIQKLNNSSTKRDSLQYYIIAKKSDLVYGPYDKKRYMQKRKELNVPNKLILKVE